MRKIVDCLYCGRKFRRKITPKHAKRCFLSPENILKIADFVLSEFYVRTNNSAILHIPRRIDFERFLIKNRMPSFRHIQAYFGKDLGVEGIIDSIFWIGVSRKVLNFTSLPPHLRFFYDAFQYFTESEFCDRMKFAEVIETLVYKESENAGRIYKHITSRFN
jgi:hypothetical protein